MTDEIKVLCPKCGSDKVKTETESTRRLYCKCKDKNCRYDFWEEESTEAQLLAAREQIAELKTRIDYLVKFRDMADPVIKKLRGDK